MAGWPICKEKGPLKGAPVPDTPTRARKFGLQLATFVQLTLSLSTFQFTYGTLPSELREPACAIPHPYHRKSFARFPALLPQHRDKEGASFSSVNRDYIESKLARVRHAVSCWQTDILPDIKTARPIVVAVKSIANKKRPRCLHRGQSKQESIHKG